MIVAATRYFSVVDTVGIRMSGEIAIPVPQRVVIVRTGRGAHRYTVGTQREGEGIIRGACRYSTYKKAMAEFSECVGELVEDGYVTGYKKRGA